MSIDRGSAGVRSPRFISSKHNEGMMLCTTKLRDVFTREEEIVYNVDQTVENFQLG